MASSVEKAIEEPAPPVASPCFWMLSRMRRVRSPKAGAAAAPADLAAGASIEEDEAGGAVARTSPRARTADGWVTTKAAARCGCCVTMAAAPSSSASVVVVSDDDRAEEVRRIAPV